MLLFPNYIFVCGSYFLKMDMSKGSRFYMDLMEALHLLILTLHRKTENSIMNPPLIDTDFEDLIRIKILAFGLRYRIQFLLMNFS